MKLDTPIGKVEYPDFLAEPYKDKSDIELLEILVTEQQQIVDPVLLQILVNKGLLFKGERIKEVKERITELKGE